MAPFLAHLISSSVLSANDELLSSLKSKNKEQLEKLEADLEDAKTNLGETEISDALRAKALYLARIGEKVRPCHLCPHPAVVELRSGSSFVSALTSRSLFPSP